MKEVLHNRPWSVNGYFLSLKMWSPNFVASESKEVITAIWVRLTELPTKFYDHQILAKVGKTLGRPVKMDIFMSQALRRRYARICIEVPLGTPVKKTVYIRKHKQPLVYEGLDIFCNSCGVLGHNNHNCPGNIRDKITIPENKALFKR